MKCLFYLRWGVFFGQLFMSALIAGLGLFTIMLGKDQFIEVKGSTIMFTLGSFFFLLTLMSYPIRKG